MIRLLCAEDDAGMAANIGGAVVTTIRSFDGDVTAMEEWLTEKIGNYRQRRFVGIEIVVSVLGHDDAAKETP